MNSTSKERTPTQKFFERKHKDWQQSIWKHPIAHMGLAIAYKSQPKIVCVQCYLAICAPFATFIQKRQGKRT